LTLVRAAFTVMGQTGQSMDGTDKMTVVGAASADSDNTLSAVRAKTVFMGISFQ
jgi:hypothetical protein